MSKKPIVLVDIDDTLADTQVKILEYVNKKGINSEMGKYLITINWCKNI